MTKHLTVLIAALAVFGCTASKVGQPGSIENALINVAIRAASSRGCAAIPAAKREVSRATLASVEGLLSGNPQAAYEQFIALGASDPALAEMWAAVHAELKLHDLTANQWTEVAIHALGSAIAGCRSGLGTA